MSDVRPPAKADADPAPDQDPLAGTRVLDAYCAQTARSRALAEEAHTVLPSGITHDSRRMRPYGHYIDRALGALKWDVDGNRYVDYFGGHGALLLGHGDPAVRAAIDAALDRGTQFAAGHADEVAWARAIIDLVPSAERVRFTASGTEATLMAVRLARAFTGRDLIVRFPGHYHGWQDDMTTGYASHFDGSPARGVPGPVAGNTLLADPRDREALRAVFERNPPPAAVLLEPLGSATGQVPIARDFIADLREHTRRAGTVLIFDEVITGFRVAPGGVQEKIGIVPELTAMAKIVVGGLPGGAVAGRKEILDGLDFDAAAASGREKIYHPGTFNANPISAAAGIATLARIADGSLLGRMDSAAKDLRQRLNTVLAAEGVPWAVYGQSSAFHLFLNPSGIEVDPERFDPMQLTPRALTQKSETTSRALRLAMLVHGVDLAGWPGGLLSARHGPEEIDQTVDALRDSLRLLRQDSII
ncbi:MAG: aminotransferase class III-fold pyridoxal phosphate-dependent enzyme [Pseudomonadota bacterium]